MRHGGESHWPISRPGTLNNVDSFLHCHILPAFGTWQMGRIEPADVRAFVADLVEKGLAPTTVAGRLSGASAGSCPRQRPTASSRARRVGGSACLARPPAPSSASSNPDEVRRLAEAIEDRYRVLIYTAAYTGMRWGELAGLRIPRLDLLRGTIDIIEALTEVNGTVRTGPTKTGKSRTVSIPRVPRRTLGRTPGHVPIGGRLRLHLAQGWTAPA